MLLPVLPPVLLLVLAFDRFFIKIMLLTDHTFNFAWIMMPAFHIFSVDNLMVTSKLLTLIVPVGMPVSMIDIHVFSIDKYISTPAGRYDLMLVMLLDLVTILC